MPWDNRTILLESVLDRQLQRQVVERVEDDANLVADRTSECRLVHAREKVCNDGITTFLVDVPAGVGHLVQGHRVMDHIIGRVRFLDIGFLKNTI